MIDESELDSAVCLFFQISERDQTYFIATKYEHAPHNSIRITSFDYNMSPIEVLNYSLKTKKIERGHKIIDHKPIELKINSGSLDSISYSLNIENEVVSYCESKTLLEIRDVHLNNEQYKSYEFEGQITSQFSDEMKETIKTSGYLAEGLGIIHEKYSIGRYQYEKKLLRIGSGQDLIKFRKSILAKGGVHDPHEHHHD